MQGYQHTQFGAWVVAVLLVFAAFLIGLTLLAAPTPIVISVGALLSGLLLMFSTLKVSVDAERLEVAFGPGWIRRSIPLDDIVAIRQVRNRWWYGWGIRLTPHGWLWNVAGLDAIELELRSGKKFRIGTDEPDELEAALAQRLRV